MIFPSYLKENSSKGGKVQKAKTIMSCDRDIVRLPKSYYIKEEGLIPYTRGNLELC